MIFLNQIKTGNIVANNIYINNINPYSAGIDFSRRQILTTKVNPRTVRIKIFLMAVDP